MLCPINIPYPGLLLVVYTFAQKVKDPWFKSRRRNKSLWGGVRKGIRHKNKICQVKHVKLPVVVNDCKIRKQPTIALLLHYTLLM